MISKKIKIAILAFSILSVSGYSTYNYNNNRNEILRIQKNQEENLMVNFKNDILEFSKSIYLDINNNQLDSISKIMINYVNENNSFYKKFEKDIHDFNLKIGKTIEGTDIVDYFFNDKYIEFNKEKIPEYKIYEMKYKIYNEYFSLKIKSLKHLSEDISNVLTSSQLKLIEDYNDSVYESISMENNNVDNIDKNNLMKKINKINKKDNEMLITQYTAFNNIKIVDLTDEMDNYIFDVLEHKNIDKNKIYKLNNLLFDNIKEKMINESHFIMAEMLLNNGSHVLNPDYYLDSKNNFYIDRASIDKKTLNPISKILFKKKYDFNNNFKEILIEKINYSKLLMSHQLKLEVINKIKDSFDSKEWEKINNIFKKQIEEKIPLKDFMKNIKNENNDLIKIFSTTNIIKSMFDNMDNLEKRLIKENIYTITK